MSTASRLLVVAAALLMAGPLAAQQPSIDSTSRATAPAATTVMSAGVGPRSDPSAVRAGTPLAATGLTMTPMPVNGENSQNVALMVVGGAGLIVGALISGNSGTIVMVGSGVIGLIGLFRYLQ